MANAVKGQYLDTEKLPPEMWENILEKLPFEYIQKCQRVDKRIGGIATNCIFGKWKKILSEEDARQILREKNPTLSPTAFWKESEEGGRKTLQTLFYSIVTEALELPGGNEYVKNLQGSEKGKVCSPEIFRKINQWIENENRKIVSDNFKRRRFYSDLFDKYLKLFEDVIEVLLKEQDLTELFDGFKKLKDIIKKRGLIISPLGFFAEKIEKDLNKEHSKKLGDKIKNRCKECYKDLKKYKEEKISLLSLFLKWGKFSCKLSFDFSHLGLTRVPKELLLFRSAKTYSLNLSENCLRKLPEIIGGETSELQHINLSYNPHLKRLPLSWTKIPHMLPILAGNSCPENAKELLAQAPNFGFAKMVWQKLHPIVDCAIKLIIPIAICALFIVALTFLFCINPLNSFLFNFIQASIVVGIMSNLSFFFQFVTKDSAKWWKLLDRPYIFAYRKILGENLSITEEEKERYRIKPKLMDHFLFKGVWLPFFSSIPFFSILWPIIGKKFFNHSVQGHLDLY